MYFGFIIDFCFRDAFGNVIVKVEILGIVRKIFTAASGDFQVITGEYYMG